MLSETERLFHMGIIEGKKEFYGSISGDKTLLNSDLLGNHFGALHRLSLLNDPHSFFRILQKLQVDPECTCTCTCTFIT